MARFAFVAKLAALTLSVTTTLQEGKILKIKREKVVQKRFDIQYLIELVVERVGEDGGGDDLCDEDRHQEEQVAVQGPLNGGELVLGDLGVEAHLGLGAGVHADPVNLPGVLQEGSSQQQVVIAANMVCNHC